MAKRGASQQMATAIDLKNITRKFMIGMALTAMAAMLIVGARGGMSAAAQSGAVTGGRIITVSGRGLVSATPDIARITAGVTSQGKSAAEALKINSTAMGKVIAQLKRAGLEPKDIQTSNLVVQPRQQRFRDGRPPIVTGYQVSNQVRLIIRDLDQLGDLLDEIVKAGANKIYGIAFDVSKAGKIRDAARGVAIEDARRKADLYAKAAGARLGQILSITEHGAGGAPPPIFGRAVSLEAVPIERGIKTLQVRVSASWQLE